VDEEIVDGITEETQNQIDFLTTGLEAGDYTPDEYRELVEDLLEDAYLQQATLANKKKLPPVFIAIIMAMLMSQVDRLVRALELYIAGRIFAGEVGRRAGMYANSSRQAYWAVRDRVERGEGAVEEHWFAIGDKNTCSPCRDAEGMGWQPLGTFAQPGSGLVLLAGGTTCHGLTHCRCRKQYR
jgi:hypothetical protein